MLWNIKCTFVKKLYEHTQKDIYIYIFKYDYPNTQCQWVYWFLYCHCWHNPLGAKNFSQVYSTTAWTGMLNPFCGLLLLPPRSSPFFLPSLHPSLTFRMISVIYPGLEPGLSCLREGGVCAGPKSIARWFGALILGCNIPWYSLMLLLGAEGISGESSCQSSATAVQGQNG